MWSVIDVGQITDFALFFWLRTEQCYGHKMETISMEKPQIGDEHYTNNFHPMSMVGITDHGSHSVFQFYAPYIHIG